MRPAGPASARLETLSFVKKSLASGKCLRVRWTDWTVSSRWNDALTSTLSFTLNCKRLILWTTSWLFVCLAEPGVWLAAEDASVDLGALDACAAPGASVGPARKTDGYRAAALGEGDAAAELCVILYEVRLRSHGAPSRQLWYERVKLWPWCQIIFEWAILKALS